MQRVVASKRKIRPRDFLSPLFEYCTVLRTEPVRADVLVFRNVVYVLESRIRIFALIDRKEDLLKDHEHASTQQRRPPERSLQRLAERPK